MSFSFAGCTSPSAAQFTRESKSVTLSNPFEDCFPIFALSSESLSSDRRADIRLDEIVQSTIILGVTSVNPAQLGDVVSDTIFENGWLLQGSELAIQSSEFKEPYPLSLKDLVEGDYVSIELHEDRSLWFSVNGIVFGRAFYDLPCKVYPVVGMYGKRVRVTFCDFPPTLNDFLDSAVTDDPHLSLAAPDTNIMLSEDATTASRISSDMEHNYVFTNRPLNLGEIFHVKLESSSERWSGAMEIGLSESQFQWCESENMPHCILLLRGTNVLFNGAVIDENYCPIAVEQLNCGDRLGISISPRRDVHFYLNDVDLGPVSNPGVLKGNFYGFVNMYGKTTKISLVDLELGKFHQSEAHPVDENRCSHPDNAATPPQTGIFENAVTGPGLKIGNNGLILIRDGQNSFAHCIAFFDGMQFVYVPHKFRIDRICEQAPRGSLSIGMTNCNSYTSESASSRDFRRGTVVINSDGLISDGRVTDINLSDFNNFHSAFLKMEVGDNFSVELIRDAMRLVINNQDVCAFDLNFPILGDTRIFMELSSKVTQLSVIPDDATAMFISDYLPEDVQPLRFHCRHGNNCSIEGQTAYRPNPDNEFSDAIVMSHRPLADNELFEISIDAISEHWSGSLEIGLTSIDPDKMVFPKTMTQITTDIWMISGSAVVHNGNTIWNNFNCNFDQLKIGSTVGVMRRSDGTMHIWLDGVDQGIACVDVPSRVYAIVDLYGQCHRVSIVNESRGQISTRDLTSQPSALRKQLLHSFYPNSSGLEMNLDCTEAHRIPSDARNSIIVFSNKPIIPGEVFRIEVNQVSQSGGAEFKFGLCNFDPSLKKVDFSELENYWFTCYLSGSDVYQNYKLVHQCYCPSLIAPGVILGLQYFADGSVRFSLNDMQFDRIQCDVPKNCFAFFDMGGSPVSVIRTKSLMLKAAYSKKSRTRPEGSQSRKARSPSDEPSFDVNHGLGIKLSEDNRSATRISTDQAVVVVEQPLHVGKAIDVKIDEAEDGLSKNLAFGVVFPNDVNNLELPNEIRKLKSKFLVVSKLGIIEDGYLIASKFPLLDSWLQPGVHIGLLLDFEHSVHLLINGVDQGVLIRDAAQPCHAILDMKGCISRMTITPNYLEDVKLESEKATLVDSIKEQNTKSASGCPYVKLCNSFRKSLRLPEAYFTDDEKSIVCYCETCNKERGTEMCFKQGEPVKPFTLPKEWVKFNTKLNSSVVPDFATWQVAYHCLPWRQVRRLLDVGSLVVPEEQTVRPNIPDLTLIGEQKLTEKFGSSILLSPTIQYCSLDMFCPPVAFVYDSIRYKAKLAVQVWVKPGACTHSYPSISPTKVYDPSIPLNEHEWLTKEKLATSISSLLVKVIPDIPS